MVERFFQNDKLALLLQRKTLRLMPMGLETAPTLDPAVRLEIQEAYLAYQAGQYMTIDEYLATIE